MTTGTVILELSNPELQQSVKEAQLAHQSAQAAFQNRKAELESSLLSQQSNVAGIEAKYKNAMLTLEANEQLAKDELISAIALKQSRAAAEELKNQLAIEQRRLEMTQLGIKSQIAPQEADVNQRRAAYDLRLRQLEDLKVKSSMAGVLQLVPVEVGASVQPGANLARVANPHNLKAELRIAETQTKDITLGHPGGSRHPQRHRQGTVSRIDPASANGTVGVDVILEGATAARRAARPQRRRHHSPRAARQRHSTSAVRHSVRRTAPSSLFKVGADGEAMRVNVKLGRSSVNTIEIIEGLQPGDQVILSDMSSYDEYSRIKLSS